MSFTKSQPSDLSHIRALNKARMILAVPAGASKEQILAQYHLIVKANHPDVGGCQNGTYTLETLRRTKDFLLKELEKI